MTNEQLSILANLAWQAYGREIRTNGETAYAKKVAEVWEELAHELNEYNFPFYRLAPTNGRN